MIYGGKDLWNRCVLSLEWKREEVMDGVTCDICSPDSAFPHCLVKYDYLCCRHVGDLGNVEAVNGVVETTINDHMVTLFGEYKVIGRSFVVSIVRIYI